jgi:hypothetical protein
LHGTRNLPSPILGCVLYCQFLQDDSEEEGDVGRLGECGRGVVPWFDLDAVRVLLILVSYPRLLTFPSENDITDIIDETMTTSEDRFGEMVTIELKPGGADVPVTQENKKEYVDLIVEYRIQKRVQEQFEAFMSGFNELIPQELINVFDERELELLIGGMSEIDV